MEVVYQVYEKIPETIAVPENLWGGHVKVTLQKIEPLPEPLQTLDVDLEAKAASLGLKLEDVKDLHALRFMGCLPDFPPRAPQGEYEIRPELDLL